jgi:hypothetical protein
MWAPAKQFVIAPRQTTDGLQALGLQPLQFAALEQALRNSSDIEVVDKVGPKSVLGALADGMGGGQGVLVARMTEQSHRPAPARPGSPAGRAGPAPESDGALAAPAGDGDRRGAHQRRRAGTQRRHQRGRQDGAPQAVRKYRCLAACCRPAA